MEYVEAANAKYEAVANANPLRYRGYYLDSETGYYYLQSRYYDPSICRFINADDIDIVYECREEQIGTNLFAYCCNDPVDNADFQKKMLIGWANTVLLWIRIILLHHMQFC